MTGCDLIAAAHRGCEAEFKTWNGYQQRLARFPMGPPKCWPSELRLQTQTQTQGAGPGPGPSCLQLPRRFVPALHVCTVCIYVVYMEANVFLVWIVCCNVLLRNNNNNNNTCMWSSVADYLVNLVA